MMSVVVKAEFFEDMVVVLGLMMVQLVFSGYGVMSSYIMSLRIQPLFLVTYANLIASLFYLPLSFMFERKLWPNKFSLRLFGQFILISIGGVTMFQVLMLIGVKKTSAAVASCMPNLAPGLIFIIAWLFRFEKVNLHCRYSRVKILGTFVCITGAITMSLFHSSASRPIVESTVTTLDSDTIIGTLCMMAAVMSLSFNIILQAATLVEFPAPMSLSIITSFIAAGLTGLAHYIQEHEIWAHSEFISGRTLLGYLITGGVVAGGCSSFQSWAMKRKGPVFVSTFNPVGTVFSVILSAVLLSDVVTLGSILGMFLMFTGLYSVLWAKKKEDLAIQNPSDCDPEKPLLS